jgi:hypothetical protein
LQTGGLVASNTLPGTGTLVPGPGFAIVAVVQVGTSGSTILASKSFRITLLPAAPAAKTLRLTGVYPEGTGIPYSVTGQNLAGSVTGQYALRISAVYPWIPDEVGPLTCLKEINGHIVAAMYPSIAFGPSYASYIIVKDPYGSPLVRVGGAGGGPPSLIAANYCDDTFLASMIGSTPADQFKPGVTLISYP